MAATFGEIMLRLKSPDNEQLMRATFFNAYPLLTGRSWG